MSMQKYRKPLLITIILIASAWVFILVTGKGFLLNEKMIHPGTTFYVNPTWNVGNSQQDSLVCKYFNGGKLVYRVYWYSPNNFMGRDSCPFILEE